MTEDPVVEERSELLRELGATIQRRREQIWLSRAELAERAGISDGYLREIEAGRRNPSVDVLERLAGPLNMQPSWLLRKAELETKRWKKRWWRERIDDQDWYKRPTHTYRSMPSGGAERE